MKKKKKIVNPNERGLASQTGLKKFINDFNKKWVEADFKYVVIGVGEQTSDKDSIHTFVVPFKELGPAKFYANFLQKDKFRMQILSIHKKYLQSIYG